MPPFLTLLDSDKTATFTNHTFGNILAGNTSLAKLLFVSSTGDEDATGSKFAVRQSGVNDGYSFTEIAFGNMIDASPTALTGTVEEVDGFIPDTPELRYRITVVDSYGLRHPRVYWRRGSYARYG